LELFLYHDIPLGRFHYTPKVEQSGGATMKLFKVKENNSKLVEFISHRNNGVFFSKRDRWNEAISAYKRAINIKFDDAKIHYDLAIAYMMIKDRNSAVKEHMILKGLDKYLAEKLSGKLLFE
jgi:Flp pilus assembly protein TadD